MTKRRGKGDGSIYRRESDGLWVASIRIDRGKRKTVYGKTRQEVAKKLKAVQRDIEQGTLITARAQSVETYLRYWLDTHRPEIAESTYRTYVYLMKPVYPHTGSITLTKLTPDQIQRMYAAISKDHAISYIRQIHRVLTAAFNDAILWNRLSKNPCKVVVLPKKQYNEEEVQHALDAEQCLLLIDTAKGTPLETFVVLALGTALRRGEMLALEWSDINLDEKTISITKTLSYLPDDQGHSRTIIGDPKSKTSKRTLTLPDFVIEALRSHRTRQKKERMAAPAWSDKNLVFPDSKGEYRNVKTVQKQFNRLLAQAGLPDIHIHDLRHSCATLLLKMGVPMKVVQEILGHSSITITMDVYGHVTPGMQEDAMNKIDGIFKREKEG